jgi:DNA-binding transcriptional LysR family regulator
MQLTFRQLQIFVAVARLGNATKAAEKLYLTQAAVSMAINEMERLLEKKLFERVGRRIVLNEYGRVMFEKAVELLNKFCDLESLFTDKEKVTGLLKLGATITIGNYVLPPLLIGFIKKYPDVKMEIKIENTEEICKMINEYDIDVAFIEGLCGSEKVDKISWLKDSLVLFASKDNPLSNKKEININDLKNVNWILREKGSGTRQSFEKAIKGKLNNINVIAEIGSNEAIKRAVESGMGISCLSYDSIKRDVETGLLKIIQAPWIKIEREFSILTNCCKYKTTLLDCFLKYMLGMNAPDKLDMYIN